MASHPIAGVEVCAVDWLHSRKQKQEFCVVPLTETTTKQHSESKNQAYKLPRKHASNPFKEDLYCGNDVQKAL